MDIEFQNSDDGIRHLKATSALYSSAKLIAGLRNFLNTLGVAIVTLIYLAYSNNWWNVGYNDLSWIVAAYSFVIILLDKFLFSPSVIDKIQTATAIQQAFDCRIFSIPWNNVLFGNKVDNATIALWAGKAQKTTSQLTDWYSPDVKNVPDDFGVLLCQNTNCWWDNELRKKYNFIIISIGVILAIGCIAVASYSGITVRTFFSLVVAPITPYVLFSIDTYSANVESIQRCRIAQENLLTIINSVQNSPHVPSNVAVFTREMQWFLFNHRKTNPLVPDVVHTLTREANEVAINSAIESHVELYLESH